MPVDRTFNFERKVKNSELGKAFGFDDEASGLKRKEIIVQEIGTKKSRKILNQMKNKVIEEDKIKSASEIKKIIKLQAGEFKEEIQAKEAEQFAKEWERKRAFLPDFNLSAKSAAKLYNLRSIISDEDDSELYLDNLDEGYNLHYYISNLYDAYDWDAMKDKARVEKKKQLLYLNYLIKMKKLKKIDKPLEEVSESLGIPMTILRSMVDKFYEPIKVKKGEQSAGKGVKFSKTKALDLRLICYILILNLIIRDFKINLKPLMKVLKIDEPKWVCCLMS